MEKLELDNGRHSSFLASDRLYHGSVGAFKPGSPTPSMRTVSSTNSFREIRNRSPSGSTTAPNSDLDEGLELDSAPTARNLSRFHPSSNFATADDNVIVVNADNNPALASNTHVAINNSTDIQFGNKTFYNGPVTIKQFLLDDKNNKWISRPGVEVAQIENGANNKGFEGSQNAVNENAKHTIDETCDNGTLRIKNLSFSRRSALMTFLTVILSFFAVVLLLVYIGYGDQLKKKATLGDGDDSRKNIAINSTIGSDLLVNKVLRMVSRDEWLAQPPNNELTDLILPVNRVIITHTATDSCETQASCTLRVRLMQTFHMESKSWDDIGYNFMVGGDGDVYEGRGWDKQGAHTKGYNSGSIGIAYIGTFNKKLPNDKQLNAGFLLMQEGVKLKKLLPDYKIYAHRQLIASESPGATFFELIKKWPHWTQDVPE